MGILEKISEIEKEISKTQKNKATEYHLGLLKAKLARYRTELLEPSKKAGEKGEGFDVMKSVIIFFDFMKSGPYFFAML